MRLAKRVAIITGGTRGLGRAAALRFCQEGARVIVAGYDPNRGEETAAWLREQGHTAQFLQVDVADSQSVQAMVDSTLERWERVDILVNNAGVTQDSSLMKMSEEQFDRVISVNLRGAFSCTKAVAPAMVAQRYGRIINTASVVALYGNFGQSNYAAAKAGLIGMTKTWAKELGAKGITVNAVAPGFIRTDMLSNVPERVLEMVAERVPIRRLGEADDVAGAYLFLASDEARYVNGAVLSVDGGLTI